MRYVVFDLEATCWDGRSDPVRSEVIEIGAVMLETSSGPIRDEFARFVRPIAEPTLSEFCTTLTGIRQEDVDRAQTFAKVLPEFLKWIGVEPFTLCSWGDFDLNQLKADCRRHCIVWPSVFDRHVNLKQEHAQLRGIRRRGMKRALRFEDIPLEGTHHRGIDDARNIARLALLILPGIEKPSTEQK